ncbi:MAG TPA: NrsF family protein [Vicinamibacterales bacterium]|nr:NrsF family protein [Vicinamibacterales bacterium]
MNNDSTPPDALLAEVGRDLRPVRAWPTPWRDALRLSPLALGIIVALPVLVGLRRDAVAVGPLVVWGVSLIQVAVGIVLIWMATREGRPARRLPRGVVRTALAVAGFMVVAVSFLTFSKSPTHVPHGTPPWIAGMVCYFGSTLVATPLFALAAWFHSRFVSPRPALAGGLYGAGAALTSNAGWRLICPISTPWHVLTAHGGAVISITLLSALIAHLAAVRARRS